MGIQRILVIKWCAMGDVVLLTTVMEDLRKTFSDAEIHFHTLPVSAVLFKQDSRFSHIFSVDVRKKGERLHNAWKWIKAVPNLIRVSVHRAVSKQSKNDKISVLAVA